MVIKDKTFIYFSALIIFGVITVTAGQNFNKLYQEDAENSTDGLKEKITWCTVNKEEQEKCLRFANATERDAIKVPLWRKQNYKSHKKDSTYFGGPDDQFNNIVYKLNCKQASNKDECMTLLDEGKVTLTSLDSGQVFIAGRYHSLIPVAQEVSDGGFNYYYSVAVIKKDDLLNVNSLRDLRYKRACFAGVGSLAGWTVPIYTLMREGGMKIIDCNNHVKSATEFFGPSCAVNCLTNKYNPIGDNSDKLCQLCIGKIPGGRCTDSDPYAGYEGALQCLLEVGDIAFLKHTTLINQISSDDYIKPSKDRFQLLCKDGSRRPVDDYRSCNWGIVPSDAIVTSSAASFEDREVYIDFLKKVVKLYGPKINTTYTTNFDNDRNRNTNRGSNKYDQFGNRIYNRSNEYDQFGNRFSNRFKRQNFGQYGRDNNQDNRNSDQYGRYNENRNNQGLYNENDPNRNNQYGRYNQNNQTRNDSSRNPYASDPFNRDPYRLNKDQYGVNIDPYGREPTFHRDSDQLYEKSTTERPPYRGDEKYEEFFLFQSLSANSSRSNLLFQDVTINIVPLPENKQTFKGFLGESLDIIMGVRDCPVGSMTLCITSDAEQEKCVKMKTALKAQLLKPEMNCYKGHSQIHCMQAIRAGTADVTVLDASDVYTAGLNFDLVPFINEVYDLGEPEYYVVAVAKESDPSTELTYLKNKYTCHGGINTAAGWVYPLAFLISNGWIRPYGCNSIRAAAEYFTKSCVPGALSTEYNTGVPYDNMCDLCHGASYRYCRRDASEDYYGHTGAFRCLVEGGGHVAFVKHTTVLESTGGKRKEWWARDALNEDFELLCPDGTRAEIHDYKKCNLGKVKANAIVTRGGYGYNETQINAYIHLFLYSQTFYGRKIPDEFSFGMFYSAPPYTDLIFQDATLQLKVIEPRKRHYSDYLGSDFMRARRIVDCHAGAAALQKSLFALMISTFIAIIVIRS